MSESTGDATAELDLVSFVWPVYDDLVAIAYMGYPLFVANEQRTEDGGGDLSEFLAWFNDAWPGVLGTRDEVIRRILAPARGVIATQGLSDPELGLKLVFCRRARNRLREVIVEDGDEISYKPPVAGAPANLQPALPRAGRFRRMKKVLKWVSVPSVMSTQCLTVWPRLSTRWKGSRRSKRPSKRSARRRQRTSSNRTRHPASQVTAPIGRPKARPSISTPPSIPRVARPSNHSGVQAMAWPTSSGPDILT